MRHLLDADAVIDLLGGVPTSVGLVQDLERSGDTFCTCDVVVAEVHAGLHPRDQTRALHLFAGLEYLSTSVEAARQAGTWRYGYLRQGQTISITDCLIAAVASSHSATVVTGNVKDFPMPQLTIIPLPRPGRRKKLETER